MTCPYCGAELCGRVIDSRSVPLGRLRRRQCNFCGKRFSTIERVVPERVQDRTTSGICQKKEDLT